MSTALPPLNWLRVFEAAARFESFARAAHDLNMSPAAVSQQVRALEDRLGTPLFTRHAHAVRLTEMGRAYLPGVQQGLQLIEGTTQGLFGDGRAQHLYVQSVLLFAHGILAPAYADFTARHPSVAFTLATAVRAGDVAQGLWDMRIVFGTPLAQGGHSDALLGEVLSPVARGEIAAQITRPADLLEHPLIEATMHRAGWAYVLERLGVAPGRARIVTADNTVMASALAQGGVGIALARSPASDPAVGAAGLVPCLDGAGVPGREAYHLTYPDRAGLRAPARAFRAWLLDHCAGLGVPPPSRA